MNESQTRGEHIDTALKAAGWGIVEGSKISREFPITKGRLEGLGRRGQVVVSGLCVDLSQSQIGGC